MKNHKEKKTFAKKIKKKKKKGKIIQQEAGAH